MIKFVLMVFLTAGSSLGGFVRGPYIPLAMYYFYAVFRPQFLWEWQLLDYPQIRWSFYVASAALLSYVLWFLGLIGSRNEPERWVFPPFVLVHKIMFLFMIWITISFALAHAPMEEPDRPWKYYQEYLKIFVMYLLTTQVVRSGRQVWGLYMIVTLAIGYIAADLNHLYINTQYLMLLKRGYAGLDNNGAALMLAMGIPLCYFAWEFTRGWYRWGFLLFIPLILHMVVASYSRGAMMSAIMVAPLYMMFSRKKKFLLLSFVAVAFMIPFLAGEEIRERFMTIQQAEVDQSFKSRQDSWMAAVRIANEYPVFGYGIRCSSEIVHLYGADFQGRTIHSQYLQMAADSGWFGMLLYIGAFAFTIISIWRTRRRLWRNTDHESQRTVAMLGGIEIALWTFAIGASALSLETVELPYLLLLLGAQLWAIQNAKVVAPFQAQIHRFTNPTPEVTAPPPKVTVEDVKPKSQMNTERVPLPTRRSVSDLKLPDLPKTTDNPG